MANKMPYIADKKLYAAVMFACKMIREEGYFNKAVKIAARYYDVDADDVASEIRKRQSVGQTGKKRGKYKYYTCCMECIGNDGGSLTYYRPFVAKATCRENASGRYSWFNGSYGNYAAEAESVAIKEYETKKEAEENLMRDFAEKAKEGY